MLSTLEEIIDWRIRDEELKDKIFKYLNASDSTCFTEDDLIKLDKIVAEQTDEWYHCKLKSLSGNIEFSLKMKERKNK